MSENRVLASEEKELLQARRRLEEAETRQRVKERKARTRRLIQEGAILESVALWVAHMELDALKRTHLCQPAGYSEDECGEGRRQV